MTSGESEGEGKNFKQMNSNIQVVSKYKDNKLIYPYQKHDRHLNSKSIRKVPNEYTLLAL